MQNINSVLTERLEQQRREDRYRRRFPISRYRGTHIEHEGQSYLSFASNDYLGLSQHPELIISLQNAAEKYGVGSTSSALIGGYSDAHQTLEIEFSKFLKRDRAIFLGNGYLANLGTINALASQRSDTLYQDKRNHASLIDAALLSKAQLKRYPHNDFDALERALSENTEGVRLISSESVFSMDGTQVDLKPLSTLAKKHNALLMIDDAHGLGVIGQQGKSVADQLSQEECPLIICPFGKAMGCYGAIVAGSEIVIENILQFARTYTYTTALPPALAATGLKALEILRDSDDRRETLHRLIQYFRTQAQNHGLKINDSQHAIQILEIGNSEKTLKLSKDLLKSGIYLPAIRPPTVSDNQSRLRISLTALHTEEEIDRLIQLLVKLYVNL